MSARPPRGSRRAQQRAALASALHRERSGMARGQQPSPRTVPSLPRLRCLEVDREPIEQRFAASEE